MRKVGKKRILSWMLVFALVFSLCPDIEVEQRDDGSVGVEIGAYSPEVVKATSLSELGTDWDYETTNDQVQNEYYVILTSYKGNGGSVNIPAAVTSANSLITYKVCLQSFIEKRM